MPTYPTSVFDYDEGTDNFHFQIDKKSKLISVPEEDSYKTCPINETSSPIAYNNFDYESSMASPTSKKDSVISQLMNEINSVNSSITKESKGLPINLTKNTKANKKDSSGSFSSSSISNSNSTRRVSFSQQVSNVIYIPSNNVLKQVEKARTLSNSLQHSDLKSLNMRDNSNSKQPESSFPKELLHPDCSLTSIFMHKGNLLTLANSPNI
ncbi:hypothetical protein AYI70_g8845 [Smittium culicis]|uniref:Uncharacterized protein n=1 Tax=Smittium culicis TaxID=133412 RepID=A0A1R1XE17_9FUNG|nr:hypothetical protein AYI70_g10958 [Smittium culicis]OMJ12879.1 hypothetical protein AYI70_g8845 [Smittium culicis]